MLFKAQQLGGVHPLSQQNVDDLLALRRRYGYGLPKDEALFQDYYAAVGLD